MLLSLVQQREGQRVPLSDEVDITDGRRKRGIDIIGDAFEADRNLSVNYQYYGDLHNFAHIILASAHDPDGSHGVNYCFYSSPIYKTAFLFYFLYNDIYKMCFIARQQSRIYLLF